MTFPFYLSQSNLINLLAKLKLQNRNYDYAAWGISWHWKMQS